MFFSPLLSFLARRHYSDRTHILSLSNGGSAERAQELKAAASRVYGIRKERVRVIDDLEPLADGINTEWASESIMEHVAAYVAEKRIELLFSFDAGGVSRHPNHCAIYRALQGVKDEGLLHGTDAYWL